MKRVTLDTNEYVSAFHFGGRAKHLLHMAVDGDIEIAVSRPIITETLRVLREKFHWEGYDILDAGQRIERIARMVEPTETLSVTSRTNGFWSARKRRPPSTSLQKTMICCVWGDSKESESRARWITCGWD